MDFVYCALALVFAAAMIGFVVLCARVEKRP
jgi:membrane glycosyltransferase